MTLQKSQSDVAVGVLYPDGRHVGMIETIADQAGGASPPEQVLDAHGRVVGQVQWRHLGGVRADGGELKQAKPGVTGGIAGAEGVGGGPQGGRHDEAVADAAAEARPGALVFGVRRRLAEGALAEEAGLTVIMNRCPKIEYARLSGELGWCGINSRVITAKSLRPPKS